MSACQVLDPERFGRAVGLCDTMAGSLTESPKDGLGIYFLDFGVGLPSLQDGRGIPAGAPGGAGQLPSFISLLSGFPDNSQDSLFDLGLQPPGMDGGFGFGGLIRGVGGDDVQALPPEDRTDLSSNRRISTVAISTGYSPSGGDLSTVMAGFMTTGSSASWVSIGADQRPGIPKRVPEDSFGSTRRWPQGCGIGSSRRGTAGRAWCGSGCGWLAVAPRRGLLRPQGNLPIPAIVGPRRSWAQAGVVCQWPFWNSNDELERPLIRARGAQRSVHIGAR